MGAFAEVIEDDSSGEAREEQQMANSNIQKVQKIKIRLEFPSFECFF